MAPTNSNTVLTLVHNLVTLTLKMRGYSLVLGEEGIMQDRGVCLERGMGRVWSLRDGYD